MASTMTSVASSNPRFNHERQGVNYKSQRGVGRINEQSLDVTGQAQAISIREVVEMSQNVFA